MTEPTYEYVKGQGWVPTINTDIRVGYRTYYGNTYKVTVRKPKLGDHIKRGEYSRGFPDIEELEWWEDWEGIPAGFGGGMHYTYDTYGETAGLYEIITELVE